MNLIDQLNLSRKELLDLGLRNPLLNHRGRARQIRILDELSSDIFRILVSENRKMKFLPLKENDENYEKIENGEQGQTELMFLDVLNEIENNGGKEKRHIDTKLQTALDPQSLQKKLITIHRDAKTYIEEQGVNILYLALGFLHWYESDSSEELRKAPLVLIPVELIRTDVKEKFQIQYSGADITDNLSLCEKMKLEFNIKIPEIGDDEVIDLNGFFQAATTAIKGYEKWKIEANEITLGFFSFGKFLMYQDLDSHIWPSEKGPLSSEILKSLLIDGIEIKPSKYDEETFIDNVTLPTDLHLVMDADSSQIKSILDIKDGQNLVIQGPPGTGKSQTITNIIATALSEGKSVLFVSEKMAALEVVKRRLDLTHIGDSVLELHSYKTNKRAVLDEIKRTLNLGKPETAQRKEDLNSIIKYIQELNSYVNAVHSLIGNKNISFINAVGNSQKIEVEKPDVMRFDFSPMKDWSNEDYKNARFLIVKLDRYLQVIGNPVSNPFHTSTLNEYLPDEKYRILEQIEDSNTKLDLLKERSIEVGERLNGIIPLDINEISVLLTTAASYNEAPDDIKIFNLESAEWLNSPMHYFEKKKFIYELYNKSRQDWHLEAVLKADLQTLYHKTYQFREKRLRSLSLEYNRLKKQLKTYYKFKKFKYNIHQILEQLEAFQTGQKYEKDVSKFEDKAVKLFKSNNTNENNWTRLWELASWYAEKIERIQKREIHGLFPEVLNNRKQEKIPVSDIEDLKIASESYSSSIEELCKSLRIDLRNPDYNLFKFAFTAHYEKLDNWKKNIDSLSDWVSYVQIVEECNEHGLEFIISQTVEWPYDVGHLEASFNFSWYNGVANLGYSENPIIKNFNKSTHENIRKEFVNLDRELFLYNQYRLAAIHFEQIPTLLNGGGQLGIIQSEIHKKRRHKPIRKLIEQGGNVIQKLKPVFMMSPMSIATYLPPGSLEFDLVIFDEASQVKPVDAFGALLRGKQFIIVGDDKQLPPTRFFDNLVDDIDEENYESISDLESILSLFLAKGSNQKMLQWHYRSKHESLIAVSNNEFYDNKLFIFPSSGTNTYAKGLVFKYLPGTYYDRGKSRTNKDEALELAKEVLNHIENNPELSLGVVAFSVAQRDAILFQLENLRQKDSSKEFFFSEITKDGLPKKEPFFVKNLENVQGDERDVIFISVGYGKTKEGYFPMSFGPLNVDGGERRLNVLISRSRLMMQVFSNFKANEIDLDRTKSRGVVALRNFLAYAETGIIDQPYSTEKQPDSPFEEAVLKQLHLHNIDAEPQVGTAGFFIDIGIKNPKNPNEYILGVECDGASYHSSKSARDRDRLRQEVLESLGWKIYRIWSSDYFKNPESEFKKLLYAIEKEKNIAGSNTKTPIHKNEEESIHELHRNSQTKQDEEFNDIISVDYQAFNGYLSTGGYDIHEIRSSIIAGWVKSIVQVESPIHLYVLMQRIVFSAGYSKAGSRIQRAINTAVKMASQNGSVIKKKDFLWKPEQINLEIRNRIALSNNERKIEYIAPEEIQVGILNQIKFSFSISDDELIALVGNMFGFSRVTENIYSEIKKNITTLLRNSKIKRDENGWLILVSSE